MHEELGRHDIQPLAHVLAHTRHRLTALQRRAGGVLGLVTVFDAAQMLWQRLAARLPGRRLGRSRRLGQGLAQLGQLGLQAGLVLQQRVLEHLALLGIHRLGLGAELPALQACQLEVDLLQLGVAPCDVACLALDLLILQIELLGLLRDVLEHLCGQCGDGVGRETLQVLGLELPHAEHALHLADARSLTPLADVLSTSCAASLADGSAAHTRVITLISGRRCQGRPTIKASNCGCVNASGVTAAWRGHTKRPAFRRLAAHHTPKPSCTSSLMRVARALAKR